MGLTREQRSERKAKKLVADERDRSFRRVAADALRLNCCPLCGKTVRRNLALTGWVQCSQYGSVGFRADDSQPSCSWQGFM
jgi:hypothetical protein